ncbi:hypothetical protein [Nonomuraea sp. NPDC049695]|uniref:hypothetical protein n=1 Tax=Nonomuraea sp. NPDC049695 TaxID=3154734 RepID=UPI00343035C9
MARLPVLAATGVRPAALRPPAGWGPGGRAASRLIPDGYYAPADPTPAVGGVHMAFGEKAGCV